MENQNVMANFGGRLIEWLLPARCPLTGEAVETQGMISPTAWATLRFVADPQCRSCGTPLTTADPEAQNLDLSCADCLTDPPPFDSARCSLVYDDASRKLILGFKHADQTYAVKTFVPWLARAGTDFWPADPLLVPVPLHRWRILRRRYNQSAILAHGLAREINLTCVPDLLHRTRATATQGHLKAKDRIDNVRKAFRINPKHTEKIKSRPVVLIDDVMTTGTTVRECAEVLLKAGASSVNVLTIARAVRN